MDVQVSHKKKSENKQSFNLDSGINDFSVKRTKAAPAPPPRKNREFKFDEEEFADDDFFGALQNKSKTLPDDEIMLNHNEKFTFSDDEDEMGGGGGDPFDSDFEEDDDDGEELKAQEEELSEKEIQMKKQHLLMKIERLKKQGYFPRINVTIKSDLDVIESQYDMLFKERGLEKAIKEWREDTVLYAAGGERVNKWAGQPMHLDNWSKQVYRDVEDGDYDPIFEQLHDKWGGSSMLPPEIQLVRAMGMSAIRFHFSHQVAKDAPNIHEMLNNNPQLRDQVYAQMQKEATKNWSENERGGGKNGEQQKKPIDVPVGGNKTGGKPLPRGPSPPKMREPSKMKGPSQSTHDLLNMDLSTINDEAETVIEDEVFSEKKIPIKRGRKKQQPINVATIDL